MKLIDNFHFRTKQCDWFCPFYCRFVMNVLLHVVPYNGGFTFQSESWLKVNPLSRIPAIIFNTRHCIFLCDALWWCSIEMSDACRSETGGTKDHTHWRTQEWGGGRIYWWASIDPAKLCGGGGSIYSWVSIDPTKFCVGGGGDRTY